jgi:RNA polymerase sigma-70 factor (ECF subfamily)
MGELALAGERLEQAFAAARPELVRNLARLLGNPEDAQDVAQEAFLKCWRTRGQAAQVRDLRAWIFRVGLNAARDLRRNGWRRRWRPLTDPGALDDRPGGCPGENLLYGEAVERLRRALAVLRPEERDVFLLRQTGNRTYEQIAAARGLPVGTVKTRMRSALLKLRQAFPEEARAL